MRQTRQGPGITARPSSDASSDFDTASMARTTDKPAPPAWSRVLIDADPRGRWAVYTWRQATS